MPSCHKLVDIRYIVSQGKNVFHTPAKTRQDRLYVLEYLFYLDFNISLANNIAFHVERYLPRLRYPGVPAASGPADQGGAESANRPN